MVLDIVTANPREALSAAIADCYRVFPGKLKVPVGVCPCCVDEDDAKLLSSRPRQSIPANTLEQYTHSAHGPGTENEFQYFLPRYFELISMCDFPSHSVEITLSRLGEHDWRSWRKESELIEQVLMLIFSTSLLSTEGLGKEDIGEVVIMLLLGGASTDLLYSGLSTAVESSEPSVYVPIATRFADLAINEIQGHRLANAFWRNSRKMEADISELLHSNTFAEFLAVMIERTDDQRLVEKLDMAFSMAFA